MKAGLAARRSRTERAPGTVTVHIPTRSPLLARLWLGLWLVGWFFGGSSTLMAALSGQAVDRSGFLPLWLVVWAIAGGVALLMWFWMVSGREIVTLDARMLSVRKDVFGYGWSREYERTSVERLRSTAGEGCGFGLKSPWQAQGTIAFDYGARTVRFGAGIDEAEARVVVEELQAAL